jgi:Flp pilus assembly protein TadB
MLIRNYFGVGFLRGLNSAAEVFAPYAGGPECSLPGPYADWRRLGEDLKTALGVALANISQDISEQQPAKSRRAPLPITSIISAHWSGPLPPPSELEKIDQIIPGGADRLLRMAEKEQTHRMEDAKRGQYLGWSLAAGAVIAAAVVSVCHGPWQVSVALVGIPVLGAVHALIHGRREKNRKRPVRWF